MKQNDIVKVYEDPVTEEAFEGTAKLIKKQRGPDPFTWEGVKYEMHFWLVNFEEDALDMKVYRRIRIAV